MYLISLNFCSFFTVVFGCSFLDSAFFYFYQNRMVLWPKTSSFAYRRVFNNITPTFSHGWMKMHDYKSFILRVLPNNPVIVTLLWFSPFSYLLVKVPNQKESISQSTNTVLFYFLVWIEEKTISHWSISVRPKRTVSDGLKSESYNFDNKKLPCHLQ